MTAGSLYQEEVKSDNPKVYEKYPEITNISLTQFTIKIDQTLYGDASLKEIQFGQIGVPGDDRGTTKVKQNDKMVLLLIKDPVYGNYYSVAFEDALFTVSNENKVMSMSNEAQLMKYDNTDLGLLLGDITQAVCAKK